MTIPVVIAAFAGVLSVLNLILLTGVIKRLRDYTELLADRSSPQPALNRGEAVDDFTSETVDGEPLSPATLTGTTLVGFFTLNCEPCKRKLPKFVEFARNFPGGRDRVLATVVGEGEGVAEMVEALRPVARVAVEERKGPLSTAFHVAGYPIVLLIDRDRTGRWVVTDDAVRLERLSVSAAA